MKLRSGRLAKEMTNEAEEYTSSLDFDKYIFQADIKCNLAHTIMLKEEKIIDSDIADNIIASLTQLKEEGYDALEFNPSVEDVHMAVENYVTKQIGPDAGFMHTAKSRNDQVATDIRLTLREKIKEIENEILTFIKEILDLSKNYKESVFIGFTHLQHAQPITIAHHLMAYAQSLKRDYQRFKDTYKRVNINPLGSAAMTTTSFPINRELTTKLLGFDSYMENSMDGVATRDFIAETVFDLTQLCTTLSRICEELILWSTYEFNVITMADEYCSTSSIMPQKKNPDVAEVARSKATRVNGELTTILTMLKALPYTYNRDLQEVTPHLWNAIEDSLATLKIVKNMLITVTFNEERCLDLARKNFATVTDLADLMVREAKIPFRTAHKIVGRVVNESIDKGWEAEDITSKFIDEVCVELGLNPLNLNEELVHDALNPLENVKMRKVPGGPSPEMVTLAINNMEKFINNELD